VTESASLYGAKLYGERRWRL